MKQKSKPVRTWMRKFVLSRILDSFISANYIVEPLWFWIHGRTSSVLVILQSFIIAGYIAEPCASTYCRASVVLVVLQRLINSCYTVKTQRCLRYCKPLLFMPQNLMGAGSIAECHQCQLYCRALIGVDYIAGPHRC